MPEPTLDSIARALEALGPTADDVARSLEERGLRGHPMDAEKCALARFVQGIVPSWVEARTDGETIHVGQNREIHLPLACQWFVHAFDDGKYPNLLGEPEEVKQEEEEDGR